MFWTDVEKAFSRSILFSFSKLKFLITFPVLVLCGLFVVFCRAVSVGASPWVTLSLAFLPILLSSGVLLALGVLLVRIHSMEVRQLKVSPQRLFISSLELIMSTSYLSIPPVLAYLSLWIVLGFFFLLREIPSLGESLGIIFAFAPFLLIFGSLLLCLLTLLVLFFVAPIAADFPFKSLSTARRAISFMQGRILSGLTLFILALLPLCFIGALLSLSAMITNQSLPVLEKPLGIGLEWFFIMLPFSLLMTPSVIFFFNFAAESSQLLQKK